MNVFTSGFTSSLPIFMGTWMSSPQASAPKSSEGMLSSGVAFSIGIWHTRPAMSPMTSDWATFGRMMIMARQ